MSIKPHEINAARNFIAGWHLEDHGLCTDLIHYHAGSTDKRAGLVTGNRGSGNVDKTLKDSIDVTLPPCELANRYIRRLNEAARAYIAEYDYSNKLVPWGLVEPMAIQHYLPGGGYKAWHFERDNRNELIARRHLAFMTYLNDVEDGGGTMFFYQNLTIKARRGLTLIWPAEWMFTHRGEVSPSQEKYIITGWFSTYTMDEFKALSGDA